MNRRPAFTLVELMVAITLVMFMAGLAVAFLPKAMDEQRAARGAQLLQGWLQVAKQRAFRDRVPRGLRLIAGKNDPKQIIECQYIEQPEDFTGALTPGNPNAGLLLSTNNPLIFEITGLDLWNGDNGTQPILWSVQQPPQTTGDYLEIMGIGLVHRINAVSTNTITLASAPNNYFNPWRIGFKKNAAGGGPIGGSCQLRIAFNGVLSSPFSIDWDASPSTGAGAKNVQSQLLSALGTTDPTNVTVLGNVGGPWFIAFKLPGMIDIYYVSDNLSYLGPVPPNPPWPPGPPYVAVVDSVPNPPPPYPKRIPPGNPYPYRIIRAPRVTADDVLQMPNDVVIDLNTNLDSTNPKKNQLPIDPTTGNLDILFSPSGAVITPGANVEDFLALWVRDINGASYFDIGPSIIAVHVRTGLVAAHPPNDQTSSDWYQFVRDGRVK